MRIVVLLNFENFFLLKSLVDLKKNFTYKKCLYYELYIYDDSLTLFWNISGQI